MADNVIKPPGLRRRRQRLSAEQQAEHERREIADFAARFPVGAAVHYYSTLPFGPVVETTVASEPWALGSGHVAVKLAGISGGVSIYHVFEKTR